MRQRILAGLACGLLLALGWSPYALAAPPDAALLLAASSSQGYVSGLYLEKGTVVIGGLDYRVTSETRVYGVAGGVRYLKPGMLVRFTYDGAGAGRAGLLKVVEVLGYDPQEPAH